MNPRLFLLLIVLAVCGCGQWNPPTPEEYAKSKQSLAAKGDRNAAWDLAHCYLQGYGVPLDFALAEHWFEIGAITPEQKYADCPLYNSAESSKDNHGYNKLNKKGSNALVKYNTDLAK